MENISHSSLVIAYNFHAWVCTSRQITITHGKQQLLVLYVLRAFVNNNLQVMFMNKLSLNFIRNDFDLGRTIRSKYYSTFRMERNFPNLLIKVCSPLLLLICIVIKVIFNTWDFSVGLIKYEFLAYETFNKNDNIS